MALKAGTMTSTDSDAFLNSMAEAMIKAMEKEWKVVKGKPLPSAGREDMKLMFIAISQGVVKHLKNNQSSFHIFSAGVNQSVTIDTEGVLH